MTAAVNLNSPFSAAVVRRPEYLLMSSVVS